MIQAKNNESLARMLGVAVERRKCIGTLMTQISVLGDWMDRHTIYRGSKFADYHTFSKW